MVPALGVSDAEAARQKKRHSVKQQDRFAQIVIDANTGYVLSERSADKRLYPASLTKMMTLYLTFDALNNGTLSKNRRVPVSRHASRQEPSSFGLAHGETIRVEDCIFGVVTKSANDCAVVLAEAVGGSESRFAAMMTAKARQLGMNGTNFVNASGLYNRNQYSTARDMARLAQALIRNHPRYYHYFSTASFTYRGNTYLNHNKLMATYRGMDGLKTGYVYASGYNLAASAVRGNTRLIGVVFGGSTAKSRNNTMAQLLNEGFARIGNTNVASLRTQHVPRPAQRPAALTEPAPEEVADNAAPTPQFNALGLAIVDQGDTDISGDDGLKTAAATPAPAAQQAVQQASLVRGNWAVQIGAFSSHAAGTQALQVAKAVLNGSAPGVDTISPLMTSRGMIYRARLSGMGRDNAVQACRVLKGNCIILTVD